MQTYLWNQLDPLARKRSLARPPHTRGLSGVRDIIEKVREQGDPALFEYTARFDGVTLKSLSPDKSLVQSARASLAPATLRALETARDNIERFHRQQMPRRIELPTQTGIRCFREARPIERVGFYVPGGTAPLPSTVLMLGVPSMIAENPLRILCTPPQADGSVHPAILVAAELCGIDHIYTVGGAQAITAMAYGTASIPKVDKIFGPGNGWVTEAKLQVAADPEGAAIDMPAGPSEVLVIADASANANFIAADLLSQAEHGRDSQVILVTSDAGLVPRVRAALDAQLAALPRRELAAAALEHSRCFIAADLDAALSISDAYAPEHLILHVEEPETWARRVQNAGSVFLGPWSPESVGDYASGTNHVLPTHGYARSYSGLSLESFLKFITFQHLSREGLAAIAPAVEELARIEGLEAHRRAVSLRLSQAKES